MVSTPADHLRSRAGWKLLRLLLVLESAFLVWVLVVTIFGAIGSAGPLGDALSLVIMAAVALAWVVVTCVAALRSRDSWIRGSALTLHVLLFAAGTGCLQLGIGEWWLGWAMVLVALAGFVAAVLARPDTRTPAERATAAG